MPAASNLRIASLQPSVSLVLRDLGRLDLLAACTRYCVDAIPELRLLPVTIVHDSWSADADELLATQPNLVLASVPYRMESLAAILKAGIPVVALAPHTIQDIFNDIVLLGGIVQRPERAAAIIASMDDALHALRARTAEVRERPLVYCEEWGKPLIHSQGWVDELIECAGGRTFGTPGSKTDQDTVRAADPDVLLFAWCGAGDRVPLEKIVVQRGWQDMRAVKQRRVYCIPDEWLNTPAPTLLLGAQAIAATLHPDLFGDLELPTRLASS